MVLTHTSLGFGASGSISCLQRSNWGPLNRQTLCVCTDCSFMKKTHEKPLKSHKYDLICTLLSFCPLNALEKIEALAPARYIFKGFMRMVRFQEYFPWASHYNGSTKKSQAIYSVTIVCCEFGDGFNMVLRNTPASNIHRFLTQSVAPQKLRGIERIGLVCLKSTPLSQTRTTTKLCLCNEEH